MLWARRGITVYEGSVSIPVTVKIIKELQSPCLRDLEEVCARSTCFYFDESAELKLNKTLCETKFLNRNYSQEVDLRHQPCDDADTIFKYTLQQMHSYSVTACIGKRECVMGTSQARTRDGVQSKQNK